MNLSKITVNFILLFVSILFSFYLIESFLLITQKNKIVFHKVYDFYKKNYKEYKQNNIQIVPLIQLDLILKTNPEPPSMTMPDVFFITSLSNAHTFYCNENNYWPVTKTDRYGFFNNDSIWDNKTIDFIFVGDSFLAGSCVYRDLNFFSVFSKFNKNNINLNLGVPGSSPLFEYIALKEYVEPLVVPKNIVWVYYEGNDLSELENTLELYKDTYLAKYLTDKNFTQNLSINNAKKDKYLSEFFKKRINLHKKNDEMRDAQKITNKYTYLNFITLTKIRTSFNRYNPQNIDPNTMEMFYKILEKTKKMSENLNSKLYFVYLPSIERYNHNFLDRWYFNDKRSNSHFSYNEILKIVKKLNIPLIDIKTNVFSNHKDPLSLFPSRLHHHYNEEGYKEVGSYIYNFINKL